MELILRDEKIEDANAVTLLLQAAFADHPHSQNQEFRLVNALRDANALSLALVVQKNEVLFGAVHASDVQIVAAGQTLPGRFCCIAPLAVRPEQQRQGIGAQLMVAALLRLREQGYSACVLVGDAAYYNRFGFYQQAGLSSPSIPDEYVLVLNWQAAPVVGEIHYHPAFAELE
ncbi:N-acetyltransferase [Chitinibacter bivalviorum]|uniref:N-acetyltransferase n=1 Tax=Chitinibacter bivalviorum TaxID=2739434 RepID=A0A7H9BN43_9NEIS|nr:N-acetyltransferase [Chitinibacter bivalviorum]QLG88794.1 N-acetyltransferase [Chitinibacter bivalviorum]